VSEQKFLGILFECCHLYARVYRNAAGTAYEGICPCCRRRVRVAIGPGGIRQRVFVARPSIDV
jgi:hypothetical protein